MTTKVKTNRFDWLIVISILLLAGGVYGGAFRLARLFALVMFPLLMIKGPRCKFIKDLLIVCFVFWLYCVVSLIWTPDLPEGLNQIAYYLTHFVLLFEIIVFAYYARNPLTSISQGWFFLMIFCSGIAIWEMITGSHLPMAYEDNNFIHNEGGAVVNRMTASVTFGNFNSYGVILCFAMPWIYYRLISDKYSFFNKTITVLIIALALLIVLINGSRGGILSLSCMMLLFLFKYHRKKEKFIIIVPISIAVVFILVKYYEEIFMVISMRQSILSEFSKTQGPEGGRIDIWLTALRAFIPTMGLGVGVGGMSEAILEYRTNSDIITATHNIFLEVLLQYGILWLFIFLLFIWRMIKRTNKIQDIQRRLPLQMALWIMPIYFIIDSSYLLEPSLYVLLACIYIFVYYEYFNKLLV